MVLAAFLNMIPFLASSDFTVSGITSRLRFVPQYSSEITTVAVRQILVTPVAEGHSCGNQSGYSGLHGIRLSHEGSGRGGDPPLPEEGQPGRPQMRRPVRWSGPLAGAAAPGVRSRYCGHWVFSLLRTKIRSRMLIRVS